MTREQLISSIESHRSDLSLYKLPGYFTALLDSTNLDNIDTATLQIINDTLTTAEHYD